MFTLIVAALSGSSLFGTKRIMTQSLSDCMERKGAGNMDMTEPEAQQAYSECFKEIYPDGEVPIGEFSGDNMYTKQNREHEKPLVK